MKFENRQQFIEFAEWLYEKCEFIKFDSIKHKVGDGGELTLILDKPKNVITYVNIIDNQNWNIENNIKKVIENHKHEFIITLDSFSNDDIYCLEVDFGKNVDNNYFYPIYVLLLEELEQLSNGLGMYNIVSKRY